MKPAHDQLPEVSGIDVAATVPSDICGPIRYAGHDHVEAGAGAVVVTWGCNIVVSVRLTLDSVSEFDGKVDLVVQLGKDDAVARRVCEHPRVKLDEIVKNAPPHG